MRTRIDARFERERREHALRMHCEDCALFDPERAACAHGYPTDEHRRGAGEARGLVVFCKDFELA